jgi:ABC-type nitrate/sulfonate/bicarbonate transport system substrate-binding protein
MTGLVTGEYDIAMAAIDNLVAYMEGQRESPLPETPDFFAFLGNQRGMLRVVAQPQIKSYADLKGQSIAVDALGTGFAFVLYKMLENGGLRLTDVKLERLGATPLRVQALLEGRASASIINTPLDIPLMQRGFTRLGDGASSPRQRRHASQNPIQPEQVFGRNMAGARCTLNAL